MSHTSRPTILLVEADRSLRRLIALGLEYRGMYVIEASSLSTLEAQKPDLLVIDVDGNTGSDWSLLEAAQAHPYLSAVPVVVLTWECPVAVGAATEEQVLLQGHTTCLSKPFDARALYTTIEELLAAASAQRTAQEAGQAVVQGASRRQEVLLAARVASPAPSIWPLLTAAGLLLTFIGFMGFFAISAVGLCVVLVSLLWWTLGTGGKKEVVAA